MMNLKLKKIFYKLLYFFSSYRYSDNNSAIETDNKVPGSAGDAANFQTIEEFWEALFTNEIIEIIVEKKLIVKLKIFCSK